MATIKKLIKSAPRMRGVTPVPNGPLVKKNGSTLKKGGVVKKAQKGDSLSVNKEEKFLEGLYDVSKSNALKAKEARTKPKTLNLTVTTPRTLDQQDGKKDLEYFRKATKEVSKQKMGGKIKKARVGAWQRKEGKNPSGGLNAKGVASYRRENPGSKLKMAVTTPPSKLKPGSKAAKRRKSFCARMSGVSGPMKKPNGKPTRKALALRKWNC